MGAKLGAEFIGTFWLVLGGCGSAVLAAAFPGLGFGEHSPGNYSLTAGLVIEIVMTFMFLIVILGATHKRGGCDRGKGIDSGD